MKYIVGAGIGGLFGLSVPLVMEMHIDLDNESPRIEDSQPVESDSPVRIENSLTLPDNSCRYILYDSDDVKEQAKECLDVDIPAIPAI